MAFVDHCQTAEDVRRNADAVRERRRTTFGPGNSVEFEKFMLAYLKNQMELRGEKIETEEPPPPPEPDPIEQLKTIPVETGVAGGPTIKTIQRMVAKAFGITWGDLVSGGRSVNLIRPRHVSFILARLLTNLSFPEIGRRTGKRDHTTVLHAWHRNKWLVDQLRSELTSRDSLQMWVIRSYELVKERSVVLRSR